MVEKGVEQRRRVNKPVNVYTFKVGLKGTRSIWRKIEIKGIQTLNDLHRAIYQAFDRDDPHLYAFFMSNKPYDLTSEYTLLDIEGDSFEDLYGRKKPKDARKTTIDSLNLELKQKLLYLFDFGDEWLHTVKLVGLREEGPEGNYPRVVESKGDSPPQYPDLEE